MLIEDTHVDGSVIVKLMEVRLDAHIATSFKQKLAEFIDAGHKRVVLDMSAVEFIDSSGLGAIVSSLKRMGTNGDLVVCGLKDAPMSLFKLTRMDRVFTIFADQEQAVTPAAAAG